MDELHDYEFFFGVRGTKTRKVNGVTSTIPVKPWHLRHITDYRTSMDTTTVEMGIPGNPPSDIQVFQTQGVVRKITLTGVRIDSEEYISNLQFIFGKYSDIYPHDDMSGVLEDSCSVGLSAMASVVQAGIEKYKLIIKRRNRGVVEEISDSLPVGVFDVALTNVNVEFLQGKGTIAYRIELIVGTNIASTPFTSLVDW